MGADGSFPLTTMGDLDDHGETINRTAICESCSIGFEVNSWIGIYNPAPECPKCHSFRTKWQKENIIYMKAKCFKCNREESVKRWSHEYSRPPHCSFCGTFTTTWNDL